MKNIYLEPNEEIISVVDHLIQTEDEEINLVVPSSAQIWQSSINLKLLKREADSLNKVVTFIVSDDLGAEMAERIGFKVRRERDLPVELIQEEEPVQSKENMIDFLVDELVEKKKKPKSSLNMSTPWNSKKRMDDIVTRQDDELRLTPIQPVQAEKIPEPVIFTEKEREIERKESFRWSKLFIIFIIIAVIMVGLVGYLILPNAEVSITPKTEVINFDLSVIGSRSISQIDDILNQIPLQEVEVTKTKSKEFDTTGEEEINQRARGMITIYNEYSSEDQTLLARTRFESSNGKIFRIPQSITVPGAVISEGKIIASSLEVEIIADQPGDDYNISPDDFTIPGFKGSPKFAGFYGKTTDSMSNGFVGKAKIVLSEDLKNAEAILIDELKQEVNQSMEDQFPTDLRIVKDGLKEEVSNITSDVKEGDQADKFTMEIKITMKALLFKEEDLKNLVDLNLISKISDNKTPIRETQKINWDVPVIDWEKGEVSFSLNVEENVSSKIDIDLLKKDLAGQDEVEVRKYLASHLEIEKARVSFWPFWVNEIPKQENKIKINIEI